MSLEKTGEWQLDSGNWRTSDSTPNLQLFSTKLGYPVSTLLTSGDVVTLMQTAATPANAAIHFPPEFKFSPVDGTLLTRPSAPSPAGPWIAPFGSLACNALPGSDASGLRRSGVDFSIHGLGKHNGESDADAEMPVPPPGSYHFFSGQFGTLAHALLAIDSSKGMVLGWLPASAKWQLMSAADNFLLSESSLSWESWRAEMAVHFNSQLYLPTDHGLACLIPDVPSLRYQVRYVGQSPVIGAPIVFDRKVWAPQQLADGRIQFVNVSVEGDDGEAIMLPDSAPDVRGMSMPVAYGRVAVWPCERGQLILRQLNDGSMAAQYVSWDAGVTPHFAFGCAYFSRAGDLWQLCFDSSRDTYMYVQLGSPRPEKEDAFMPRLCSGTINYRFAQKQKALPWQEPDQGDDGRANEIVIPILEIGERAVIGIKLHTTAGLESFLQSGERMRAQLILDDDSNEIVFHTAVFSQPWKLRLFSYDGKLWAYHPELARIHGWDLSA